MWLLWTAAVGLAVWLLWTAAAGLAVWLLWTAAAGLVVLVCLGYTEKKHKRNAVYTQPGICYGLKCLLAWAHFKFVRLRRAPRVHNYDTSKIADCVTNGLVPCPEDEAAERTLPLDSAEASDDVTWFGCDSVGHSLLVRLVRLPGRQAEALLLLQTDGDVYQLPGSPDTLVCNTAGGWTAGGLTMECIEPMRLWRIIYRGQLRRCPETATEADAGGATCAAGELVRSRLHFLWRPLSAPTDLRQCDSRLLVRAVARELWTPEFLSLMGSFSLDGYVQFGCLHGHLCVADGDPVEVRLRGPRQHSWSCADGPQMGRKHRSVRLQARFSDGAMLVIMADSWSHGITHLVYGLYMSPALRVSTLSSCSLSLPDLAEDLDIPDIFSVSFSADSKRHAVTFVASGPVRSSFSGRPWRWVNKLQPTRACLNNIDGAGIVEFGYPYSGACPLMSEVSLPLLVGADAVADAARVVAFDEPACRCESLVGGKAASLALMSDLDLADTEVPQGVVVTVTGYRAHLSSQPPLLRAIDDVVLVAAGRRDGHLKDACQRAMEKIEHIPVCKEIMTEVETLLKKQFGEFSQLRFAVRSSAIGEDGEEMSAAGQNDTLLGCSGLGQIGDALVRCWASLFSYHSVEYRRQRGQHVHPGMSVVIQRMVTSEVSGVMFTRDPVTGDPSEVTITANYGLGESVVSGRVEPDTIILGRSHLDRLHVHRRQLGEKQTETVMSESGGIEERPLDSNRSAADCLSDADALRLARVGVHLDKAFGGARDVEWALAEGRIFLLQSRPVTSYSGWSEFELTHSKDSALLTDDQECLTTANTGEVLQCAISPLTMDTLCHGISLETASLRRFLYGFKTPFPTYVGQYFVLTHARLTINFIKTLLSMLRSEEQDDMERATQMTLCGHLLDDKQARRTALRRYGLLSKFAGFRTQVALAQVMWGWSAMVKRAQAKFGEYTLHPQGLTTARQVMRFICGHLSDLRDVMEGHVWNTTIGQVVQIVLLQALSGSEKLTMDQEVLSEFAMLLSSTGAESADVPAALKRLGRTIVGTGDAEQFTSAAVEDALQWLQNHDQAVVSDFRSFLDTHGHRAMNEMDLRTTPWAMDPRPVVVMLQAMVNNVESLQDSKQDMSVEEAIAKLKAPLSGMRRRSLTFLLHYARLGVLRREQTKSLLVRVVHQFRLTFRYMGDLMVREGRLPEAELVFYMGLYELQTVLKTRSPTIVTRAARRRRLYPKLDQLQFPELMYGVPRPLPAERTVSRSAGHLVVHGTPVSRGRVEATARVVVSVTDACHIQRGDILVTHATDIGWSAYFPLLGGVVTELGGLISHGAVVAREYGLPCVVGATGATGLFRSGDRILLDGSQGTITRVGHPE